MKNIKKEYIDKIIDFNNGKDKKYFILTLGCKLNENDSEKISGMLELMKYYKTENMSEADLIIFNTCCIRENAEEKLYGKLGEVKKLKQDKNVVLAVGGCMMQQKHVVEKIEKSYKYDIIFGTHTLHKLPEDMYKAMVENTKVLDVLDIDGEIIEGLPIKREDTRQASVTIMNGCNNFCSYCIVPYVRGRERSRLKEDILSEIMELAKNGYKEITLLGQNVNSYAYDFADLLIQVNEIEGIEKIKFISPHPKDFSDDVINAIATCDKVSKMIHLPLQAGSNNVLKLMNRKYTKEHFLNLVDKMNAKIPNLKLSTDLIVGFAGETDDDFEETLEVIQKVNFEQIYMFIYSRRKGTPGDKMINQVPDEIKHIRFEKLKKIYGEMVDKNNKAYVGSIQNILVEGISKNNEDMYSGRTDSNKVVIFNGREELIGKYIDVKITNDHMWYLKGEIIK